MSKEEKRKLYKKKQFVVLDEIETWQQQAPHILSKAGVKSLLSLSDHHKLQPVKEVNETLNNKISLWKGDITTVEIDAIVNAANNSLLGGGGVDGAIHSSAGYRLREECSTISPCDTGDAKITAGYNLPAKYIIHTVGPIGVNPGKLSSCYQKSLEIVKKEKLRTVAFPCISTGIYGYDIEKATPVVLTTVKNWLIENHEHIDRIIFCVFLSKDVEVYEHNLLTHFPIARSGDRPGPTQKKAKKELKSEKGESKTDEMRNIKERETDTKAVKTDERVNKACVKETESDKTENVNTPDGKQTVEDKPLTRSEVKKEGKQRTMDSFFKKVPKTEENEGINGTSCKKKSTDAGDKIAENCDKSEGKKMSASTKL